MNRWTNLDNLLKKSKPKLHNEFRDILDNVVELFDELNIINQPGFNLSQSVPKSLKTKVKNKIKQWQKDGLMVGFLLYKASTLKYTYKDVIELLILGIYSEKESNINKISFDVLNNVAQESFELAKKESSKKPNYILTKKHVRDWSIIPIVALSFVDYISLLSQTASEEIFKIFSSSINQGQEVDENKLIKTIDKQEHRILSINETNEGDKFSGVLESTAVSVANKSYFEPFPNEKCIFIAELDDRTTEMCQSLNGQIFNTKDKNIFYRYSDSVKSDVKYEINGLVVGINLPPIDDHFHWCRSTISYNFENTVYIKNISSSELTNKKGGKDLLKAEYFIVNGEKLYINGKSVRFNENEIAENEAVGQWFSEITGYQLELQPIVLNPKNTKTCDFIIKDTNTKLELKSFKQSEIDKYNENFNYIYKKLGTGYGQANDFIIDITDTPINIEKAIKDLDWSMHLPSRRFVKKVYIKSNNDLYGPYVRK